MLYKKHKIRKKVVRLAKIPNRPSLENIIIQAADLSQDVSIAVERNFKIFQVDECCVTKRTIPTHYWTLPKTNVSFDQKDIYTQMQAILVAVSREYGVAHVEVYKKSINKIKFKIFLESLRSLYPFDDILLIMDNLSLHKSRDVKNRMDELGFLYAYTPVYSPQYNGVEEVINIGKQKIKKVRLESIMNNS